MKSKRTPLTRKTLSGVWCALILPWTDRDRLDARRFAREIRGYGGTGVSGVYTGGTTGEFYAQDDATFAQVTEIACAEAHALGLPIQIGASALSTRTTRMRIRTARQAGADAVQIALPFWLEMKDDEVKRFAHEIAEEAGKMPIILYLTMRSKRKLSPALLGEIAREVPTFIGTKDTGATPADIQAILKVVPDLAILGERISSRRSPPVAAAGTARSRVSTLARWWSFTGCARLAVSTRPSRWPTNSTAFSTRGCCRW